MTGADPRRDNVRLPGGIGPGRVGSMLALLLATAAAHPGWSQDANVVQDPLDPAEIGQPPARLEYDVRVFGIPVGMVSAIAIEAEGGLVTVSKPRRRYGSRGPYRVEVTYWLAPAHGLYPAKIRTASAGPLRVTAVLKKVSRDVEDRRDGEDGNPGP